QDAAKKYIDYLTQRYQSLTTGIDFTDLKTAITNANQPGATQAPADVLYNFLTSASYQKYQMTVRSMMSAQSLALNNLNQLTLERSPSITTQADPNQAAISQAIGVIPQV